MRITLPNVWPFAKLPNGFGSHRYVYSPILLDSQELSSFYLSTGSPASRSCTSTVTIVPQVVDRQCNGNADGYQLSFLAAAGAASEDDYGDRAFADGQWKCRLEQLWFRFGTPAPGYYGSWASALGNGECRRISRTCCQGRWSCTMSTTQ
jgi:hypothetical protein